MSLAIDTNKQSKNFFNKCQRTVSKVITERYATGQHNIMMRSTKFGKPISDINELSPCLASDSMSDMYCNLYGIDNTQYQASLPVTSQRKNQNIHRPTEEEYDSNEELDSYLKVFCNSKLPPVKIGYKYNTPYKIGSFSASIEKSFHWKNYTISAYTIITFLIKTNTVPVQKTSLYGLIDLFLTRSLNVDSKWGILSTPGTKALLSNAGFNHLVSYIQTKTLGGFSYPISKIKDFKSFKKDFKTRVAPHPSLNPFAMLIKEKLNLLEDESRDTQDIVKLKAHKKKALLFALPNFPAATGAAYTVPNVLKGFIYNGQLDVESTSFPSMRNLINTYRGDISECCLDDKTKLLDDYFEEMYLTGTILETTFDKNDVPIDKDSKDNVIHKSNSISTENRHRAKVLSSEQQIMERRKLVNERKIDEYNIKHEEAIVNYLLTKTILLEQFCS